MRTPVFMQLLAPVKERLRSYRCVLASEGEPEDHKLDWSRASLVVPFLLILCGCRGDTGRPGSSAQLIPDMVLITNNANVDDIVAGPQGRALLILDIDNDTLYNFPFSTINGGPVDGEPQHSAITPDRRTIYVTMSGDATLPLRLVVIALDWSGGVPTPTVTASMPLVAAGNGTQQAHGVSFTSDGLFLVFSELQNGRLRVLDTRTNQFVGIPMTHASLIWPHGLFSNPSGTMAMSTQYAFEQDDVSIWNMDGTTGVIAFNKTVTLADGPVLGAYTHTAVWLDETRFYTNCTQELTQGSATFQRSVWLVDAVAGTATAVLDSTVLLEGVSDCAIARGKLYVCEGNVETGDAGGLSVWNISDPLNPVLVKQLTAGSGLPPDFLSDAHELFVTPDEDFLFLEAYGSNHLLKINTITDNVVRIYDNSDGLEHPHGIFINY